MNNLGVTKFFVINVSLFLGFYSEVSVSSAIGFSFGITVIIDELIDALGERDHDL